MQNLTKNAATGVEEGRDLMVPSSSLKLLPVLTERDIPTFATEADEQEFWATHVLDGELLEGFGPPPEGLIPTRPRTTPVAIRFDADTLARLKAIAKKKHKGYQTLLKEFVAERLYEEEQREG